MNHDIMLSILAIVYGILSIVLAFAAQGMGSILSATITALGALSGPLGAVFAMGILMPFVNKLVISNSNSVLYLLPTPFMSTLQMKMICLFVTSYNYVMCVFRVRSAEWFPAFSL